MHPDETVYHRHDRYFRSAFATPEAGAELVALAVPRELTDTVQVVQVESGGVNLVDEQLGEQRLDLLVTLESADGDMTLVYFLFEHKAHPDADVLFQLFHYAGSVWRRCRVEGTVNPDGRVPNIIPVVVYHGARKWSAPTQLEEAVSSVGRSGSQIPDHRFSYILFDLQRIPVDEIGGGARVRAALLALKYTAEGLTRSGVRALLEAMGDEEVDAGFRRTTLRYLIEHREESETELVFTEIEASEYTYLQEDAVTIAEALRKSGREEGLNVGREEGRQEGHEQGLQIGRGEGRAQALIDAFEARFGEIAEGDRRLISQTRDESKLRSALLEIFRPGSTEEDVLAKLRQ